MGRKKKETSNSSRTDAGMPSTKVQKPSKEKESSKRTRAQSDFGSTGAMRLSAGGEEKNGGNVEDELTINKEFAERYEDSKRKQLLSTVPAALLDDPSGFESSSEDEEDEFAEQLTKGIDRRVRETLEAIRKKDPRIYNKNTKFFDNEGNADNDDDEGNGDGDKSDDASDYDSDKEPVAGWEAIADSAKAEIGKVTLKDYVRETLLKDGKLSDSDDDDAHVSRRVRSNERGDARDYEEEDDITPATRTKTTLASSEDGDDGEVDEGYDDEDFFKKKDKSAAEVEAEEKDFEVFLHKQARKTSKKAGEELLLHSYLENEKPDEKERFLRDFVLNNGWLDKKAADAPGLRDYEIEIDQNDPDKAVQEDPETGEDEFDEKVDEFEAKYNFRFEDPDGTQVLSHARTVPDSMRRPDDRRKRAREARKLRKQQEKLAKTEEIKHLKNLKKREVNARLLAIQEAAGDGIDVSGIDLEGDFDPEEFNRQMGSKFGNDYYSKKDEDMKQLTKEGIAVASERRLPAKKTDDVPEDIREDVNKLMDEYYNLDYEDIVGGVPMRFNYKKVDPQSFNMTPEDILSMEDKELNRIVSLKYLAPYRANRDIKKQSWRVHDALKKQRLAKNASAENGNETSALQALAKSKEYDHVDANGSLSHSRRKGSERGKRKRSRQQLEDGEDKGKSGMPSEAVVETEDANRVFGRQEGGTPRKPSKKRKRKKPSQAETVEGLSTSRKEAYNIK